MSKAVALVTGSSGDVGAAIAEEFAKSGVNVVLHYHHHGDRVDKLAEHLREEYDVDVLCVQADISLEEDVESMVDFIVDSFGRIDILVNHASLCKDGDLLNKSASQFKRVLEINVLGTYLCSKYVGRVMLDRGSGKIINIASTNAIDTYHPTTVDYDATQASIISLTHNFAREFSPHILVNCVCPGFIQSKRSDKMSIEEIQKRAEHILLRRFGKASEVAKVVVFLASSKASYINDSIIRVDGGRLYE